LRVLVLRIPVTLGDSAGEWRTERKRCSTTGNGRPTLRDTGTSVGTVSAIAASTDKPALATMEMDQRCPRVAMAGHCCRMVARAPSRQKAPLAVSSTDAQTPAKPSEKSRSVQLPAGSALSALQRACRDNDASAVRRHLLKWAADFWPDAPPRGLNAVAARLADARFVEPLRELDRACYTGSMWKGDALAHAFAAAPKQASMEKTRTEIPDLYT
jgi:hypothetical protein